MAHVTEPKVLYQRPMWRDTKDLLLLEPIKALVEFDNDYAHSVVAEMLPSHNSRMKDRDYD